MGTGHTVHLVVGYTGAYEDYHEWIVGAARTAEAAEAVRAACAAYLATAPSRPTAFDDSAAWKTWAVAQDAWTDEGRRRDPQFNPDPVYETGYKVTTTVMLEEDPATAVLVLLDTAPAAWPAAASAMDDSRRRALARAAEECAVHAARLAAYLEGRRYYTPRSGDGAHPGHLSALRTQNRVARAVRRALGFTDPDQPLQF